MRDLLIKSNVGELERQFRFMGGLALAFFAWKSRTTKPRPALAAAGAYGIATGTTRYDPIFHLLGIKHGQAAYRSLRQILRRL